MTSVSVATAGYCQTDGKPQGSRSMLATDRLQALKRKVTPETIPKRPSMTSMTASQTKISPTLSPDLNTLPDPRAPSPLPTGARTPSNEANGHHPDLSSEVATLSTKLINAINLQTSLDDELQGTRHELDAARDRIAQLESATREHEQALAQGTLIRRNDSVEVEEKLRTAVVEERKKRSTIERDKKGLEQELETLTSQLFEEANGMVAKARREREAADRRVEQMKAKLRESETLLASQQEQLQDLKAVLQSTQPDADPSRAGTMPSTPVVGSGESLKTSSFDLPGHTRNNSSMHSLQPPESPLHFSNLIHPVIRIDNQAYDDFVSLLRETKGGSPPSRGSSGNFTGLNVLGLGSKELGQSQSSVLPAPSGPMNSSSRSTSAQNTPNPAGHSPNPAVAESYSSSAPGSLKDSKFFKRALVEDIEPTLRLDTASGLSWLARRTALTSMTSGQLIVEPFPPKHAFHSPAYSCALCGEARASEEHIRRYRFRTSDSDEAQRYPICDFCLTRVRAVCDFAGFLRLARRGHWKNDTVEDCRVAWEECVRLREKMFWSRLGGGVVPVNGCMFDHPPPPTFSEPSKMSSEGSASKSESDLPSVSHSASTLSTSEEQQSPKAQDNESIMPTQTKADAQAQEHEQISSNAPKTEDTQIPNASVQSAKQPEVSTEAGALEQSPHAVQKSASSRPTSEFGNAPDLGFVNSYRPASHMSSAVNMTPTTPKTPFDTRPRSETASSSAVSRPASKAGLSHTESLGPALVDPPPTVPEISNQRPPSEARSRPQTPCSRRPSSPSRTSQDSLSPAPTLQSARTRGTSATSAPRVNKVTSLAQRFQEQVAGSTEGRGRSQDSSGSSSGASTARLQSTGSKQEGSPARSGASQSPVPGDRRESSPVKISGSFS